MTSDSWVETHRPTEYGQIQGNNSALDDIRAWIEDWEPGDAPLLLVGPPGVGKTTTAYVISEQEGYNLNQVNASSARKTDDIQQLALEARAGEQLVLIDECDSMSAQVNLDPLAEELKNPANPIILTANDEYDVPYALKGPATKYEYKLSKASRRSKLKDVADAEGLDLDEDDLEALADRPDLRSAIHDLQIHAEAGIPVEEDDREWESSEFEAMDRMLQEGDTDSGDIRPPWLVMWLDENVRQEFEGVEAAVAYDALARADVHLGHTYPGNFRGWRFAGDLADSVATLRLQEPDPGWVRWNFPSWVQSSMPSYDDDTGEAELYRALEPSGGYAHFRASVLPILQRLPQENRLRLALDHALGSEAIEALGIDPGKFEEWSVEKEPEGGEELTRDHGDALEGDW